jgi:hypothetical protein
LTVGWNPPTDDLTIGYIVLVGTTPGRYSHKFDAGLSTSLEIPELEDGTTYYFAVQGYSSTGVRSDRSVEISARTPGEGGDGEDDGGGRDDRKAKKLKPVKLSGLVRDGRYLELGWRAPESDRKVTEGYLVEIGSSPRRKDLATIRTSELSYSAPVRNGTYFVRVRPVTDERTGPASNEIVVHAGNETTCLAVPKVPTLVATTHGASVKLSWSSPRSGAAPTQYVLDIGSKRGRVDIATVMLGAGTTTFTAPAASGDYWFHLAAVNACGASRRAAEATVTVESREIALPGAPSDLRENATGHGVMLKWTGSRLGGQVTRYVVQVYDANGNIVLEQTTPDEKTFIEHRELRPGTYLVTVRGENKAGLGASSNAVKITAGNGKGRDR